MRTRGLVGAAGVVLAMGLAGCSYKSDYVPPKDGRARAIWKDDKVVVAGPTELPDCATRKQPPEGYTYDMPQDPYGYYYAPSSSSHVHVGVVIVGRPPVILLPHAPGGGLPSPGNLGGGGKGSEYIIVVLAVGAIVAFPFIAMGLALGHPEPEEEVAIAIDEVNAFNDQSRERLARCAAWYSQGGGR